MQRSIRKNQRLQERMEAIRKEMSRVEEDIRVVSRAVNQPEQEKSLRRLRQLSADQNRLRDGGAEAGAVKSSGPGESLADKPSVSPLAGAMPGGIESAGGAHDPLIPKPVADQRFANYFVTGGLHSVRPLRQERRIQRNKAILMAIIAVLVLYGVISMLF